MTLIRILVGIPALGFIAMAFTPAKPSVIAPLVFVAMGLGVWAVTVGFKVQKNRRLARYDRSLAESFVETDTSDCAEEGHYGEAA